MSARRKRKDSVSSKTSSLPRAHKARSMTTDKRSTRDTENHNIEKVTRRRDRVNSTTKGHLKEKERDTKE